MTTTTNKTPGQVAYGVWVTTSHTPGDRMALWNKVASAVLAHAAPKHDAEIARLRAELDFYKNPLATTAELVGGPTELAAYYQARMVEHRQAAINSRKEAESLRAELDAAKAVIEKLPKTADGVAIAPGDKVYIRSRYEDGVECMVAYIEAANLRRQVAGAFSGCYSTREAALAAKENYNATE